MHVDVGDLGPVGEGRGGVLLSRGRTEDPGSQAPAHSRVGDIVWRGGSGSQGVRGSGHIPEKGTRRLWVPNYQCGLRAGQVILGLAPNADLLGPGSAGAQCCSGTAIMKNTAIKMSAVRSVPHSHCLLCPPRACRWVGFLWPYHMYWGVGSP